MKCVIVLAWFLWVGLMVGWLSHQSMEAQIGPWTRGYVLFLGVAAMGCIVPLFLQRMSRRLGDHNSFSIVVRVFAVLVVFWLLASKVHQAGQQHDFDPFLQITAPAGDYPVKRSAATTRILCLGGSTTRGPKLGMGERYPARLQHYLHADGYAVEVINGGMYWYTSKHTQIAWVTYWRQYKPDIVIVMHAYNDLCRSFSPPGIATGSYRPDWGHFYGPSFFGARPQTFESWLKTDMFSLAAEAWGSRWRTTWSPQTIEVFKSLPEFRQNLGWLADDLTTAGVSTFFVTQPHRFGSITQEQRRQLWTTRRLCATDIGWGRVNVPEPASLAMAMKAFNAVARETAASRSLLVIEAEEALLGDTEHFDDAIHHRAPGADVLARRVAGGLKGHPLLERFRFSPPGP